MTEERYREICRLWSELKAEAESAMREYCEIRGMREAAFLEFVGVDGYGRLEFKGEEYYRGTTDYHTLDLPEDCLWTDWQGRERASVEAERDEKRLREEERAAAEREARRQQFLRLKSEFEGKDTLPTGEG